jgi:hypothetical protein
MFTFLTSSLKLNIREFTNLSLNYNGFQTFNVWEMQSEIVLLQTALPKKLSQEIIDQIEPLR